MRLIDADKLKEHIDKLPALPDGNFAGTHRSLKALINMQPNVKLTNSEWVDFLSEQFTVSRTSAKEMLHVMMSVKKTDNFKKQFSGGKNEKRMKRQDTDTERRIAEAYDKGFADGEASVRPADYEIRVGDEVIAVLTDKRGTAVVINIDNKNARYIYADGSTGWDGLSELKKTGRHFPEVEKILEAMKK